MAPKIFLFVHPKPKVRYCKANRPLGPAQQVCEKAAIVPNGGPHSTNKLCLITGYIGGTALAYILKAHPDYDVTLLVRNEDKAKHIKAKYPKANFVYGALDDAAVVEKAASEADIVVRT